jgi:hypothetical protein
MITSSDIQSYLASIAPVADEKLTLKIYPADVKTFDPYRNSFTPDWIKDMNSGTADLINRICNSIQYHTDEGQRLHEEELLKAVMESDILPTSETVELLDQAALEVETMHEFVVEEKLAPETNAWQWAKEAILLANPWELLENNLDRMVKSPSCAQGMIALFEDAERTMKAQKGHEASFEKQVHSNIVAMCRLVCGALDSATSRSENVTGARQADIYRAFAPVLRWIAAHGFYARAKLDLRELEADQSMPFGELDAPDWIEGYTGEVDLKITERVQVTVSEKDQDTTEAASLATSESFDEDDELETDFYHSLWNTEAAEWDIRDPMWMTIQEDLKPSEDIHELKRVYNLSRPRAIVKKEFEDSRRRGLSKEAAIEMCHHVFRKPILYEDKNTGEMIPGLSPQQMVLAELNRLAQTREVKDVAYLFLSYQNDYMLDEEDAASIKIQGSLPTLEDWLAIFGDEVLDSVQSTIEPDNEYHPIERSDDGEHAQVAIFATKAIDEIIKRASQDADKQKASDPRARINAFQHPVFLRAFLNAMSLSSATIYKDTDGEYRSLAQKAGWEAWLENFNAEAFKAYLEARKSGKSFEQAKSAFWAAAKTAPVKKQETIKSLKSTGLILGSGREVNWGIAVLKVKAGEIDFEDKQTKLKEILSSKGWAPNLVALL